MISYLGISILAAGYIFRSARTNAQTSLTQAIGYATNGHDIIVEKLNSKGGRLKTRMDSAGNITHSNRTQEHYGQKPPRPK